jgi:hypothetical protein
MELAGDAPELLFWLNNARIKAMHSLSVESDKSIVRPGFWVVFDKLRQIATFQTLNN